MMKVWNTIYNYFANPESDKSDSNTIVNREEIKRLAKKGMDRAVRERREVFEKLAEYDRS